VTTPLVPTTSTYRNRHRPVHPFRRAGLTPLIALGVIAVGLAACSSSSSSPTTTTNATTTTAGSGNSGSPPSTSSSATTSTAPGISECLNGSLELTLGPPNGTAGATHYGLTFKNTGAAACTMYGYPGVSFLNSSGNQIGAAAQQEGGPRVTVTLAAGGNAYASIAVTDPGIPPCAGPGTAAQVRVYPPGETQAALIAAPPDLLVCTSPNTSAYTSSFVTPVSSTAIG
jgi:Protein of unknown function (DUF4232)